MTELAMFRLMMIALIVLVFISGTALAADCKKDLAIIDEALKKITSVPSGSSGVAKMDILRAQEFRQKGKKACEAGDLKTAEFSFDQAKSILGIKTFF